MKCLILAGGRGDRMWPLSRKNYPKQFIQIKNNHSIFQETVARNMAFCDEFIISTSSDYESIIENQMKAFNGLTYRCIYEETGRNTSAPIVLTSLSLPDSEILYVVSSDHLISGENYKDDVLKGQSLAKDGYMVAFGAPMTTADTRFGCIGYDGDNIVLFTGKSDAGKAKECLDAGNYCYNTGMFMFRVGDFINEFAMNVPNMFEQCKKAYMGRRLIGNKTFYSADLLECIDSLTIEATSFENTQKGKVIKIGFDWRDIGSLDDLVNIDLQREFAEQVISNKCDNTTVINRCDDRLVLVNHLKDVLVVNTPDATYIGRKGDSNDLKEIILQSQNLWGYFNKSRLFYRVWGESEILEENPSTGYQVRKITVLPGKTISSHTHSERNEVWTIVSGRGLAVVDGNEIALVCGDSVRVGARVAHQVSCTSEEPLIFIETSTGMNINSEDFVTVPSVVPTDIELGYEIEPFVKLSPVYKDYLWGGTRLRDVYGKRCDYDVIAESWELSAHPDGQSIVASGRYKGLTFGEYLSKIGVNNLGWKFQNMRAFPLLIKLIDAKENLSVQVHPDDEYALIHENEYGKSELWHIIDAEPDAYIYVGFSRDVTKEEVLSGLSDGSITKLLNKVMVKPGEDYFIPAGTVHAIGKGVLICEVQQNSNSTYRLYDYDRTDKYGNKRTLDIDKALDVLDFSKYKGNVSCKYFECERIEVKDLHLLDTNEESFYAVVVLEGDGRMSVDDTSMEIAKGDCIFIPRRKNKIKVTGKVELFTARI